jgi:thymidylate kinase
MSSPEYSMRTEKQIDDIYKYFNKKNDTWIIEGFTITHTQDDIINDSDLIIYLDVPTLTALSNINKRRSESKQGDFHYSEKDIDVKLFKQKHKQFDSMIKDKISEGNIITFNSVQEAYKYFRKAI